MQIQLKNNALGYTILPTWQVILFFNVCHGFCELSSKVKWILRHCIQRLPTGEVGTDSCCIEADDVAIFVISSTPFYELHFSVFKQKFFNISQINRYPFLSTCESLDYFQWFPKMVRMSEWEEFLYDKTLWVHYW